MSSGPDPAALDTLRGGIGAGSPLMTFAEAVLAQAGRPLGASADPAREMHVAETLARLLAGDSGGATVTRAASGPSDAPPVQPIGELLADPLLLSAFFQNIDLLDEAGSAEGDRVATWVMTALEAISGLRRPVGAPPGARPTRDPEGG